MKPTRREAIRAVVAASAMTLTNGNVEAESHESAHAMPPLDYGRSFICNTARFNAVRFWVESRTRIIDVEAGTHSDYIQCASCKSEHTFAKEGLFKEDNYDFLPILGDGQWLVFRRGVRLSENYRSVNPVAAFWGEPELRLRTVSDATLVDSWDALRNATAAAIPLVTQTETWSEDKKLRAIVECPTKTMNMDLDGQRYQVDTGPVAHADLSKEYASHIDRLRLAYVAFNAPDFADWVVEQPTQVHPDGPDSTEVYHYSKPFSLPAENRVFALGKV